MKSIVIGLLLSLLCLVAWADDEEKEAPIIIDDPVEPDPDEFEPLPIAGFTYQSGIYALSTVVKVNIFYIFSRYLFYITRKFHSLTGSKHTLPVPPRVMIWPVRPHKIPS